ncbi:hypothetical protein BDZ91DRAFT_850472 [Kalaharituber pfeilii]|nr:hypothetical protein BDZ91DRAFT_850472 [Kalaharituber pfeilii]
MDSSLPPTYEAATARDPLPLVGRYLPRQDLLRASLVCRHWHSVFSRIMWSSPERLWEMGERSALTGFILFLRSISRLPQSSRPTTIDHTTTLSLHSVLSSIYTNIPSKWLHHLVSNLPHLTLLNLSSITFLDHDSLRYFTQQSPPMCAYTLRTFIASSCSNITSSSLESFLLLGWPYLEYLDLSNSHGINNAKVLSAISSETSLPSLRRLILRKLELKDTAIQILARGLGTRITELDIRENLVSDVGVGELLNYCFLPPEYDVGGKVVSLPLLDYTSPPPLEISQYDQAIIPARKGLTHLHLSENPKVTWYSIQNLLKTTRLEHLDCGIIPDLDFVTASDRKLVPLPILSMYAHKNLRYLRIDCRIIAPRAWRVGDAAKGGTDGMGEEQDDDERGIRLKPQMLPNLQTLVLCGVPYYSVSSFKVTDHLFQFLDDLAEAEDQVPAVSSRADSASTRPGTQPGAGYGGLRLLKLLVLEMQALTVTEDERDGGVGMYASSASGKPKRRNSDSDSDYNPDSASDDDAKLDGNFSFFGEDEDEGRGRWSTRRCPSRHPNSTDASKGLRNEMTSKLKETQVDVLSELGRYRENGRNGKEKKKEGIRYWRGQVRVVRDVGWDDSGGVEKGSVGRKWGVVVECEA